MYFQACAGAAANENCIGEIAMRDDAQSHSMISQTI
jgi:hypothetical protein